MSWMGRLYSSVEDGLFMALSFWSGSGRGVVMVSVFDLAHMDLGVSQA
jgi:hypothetical protein